MKRLRKSVGMTAPSFPRPARIDGVFFDFGGVVVGSPFEAFAELEERSGAPAGLIRAINTRNPDRNAWAHLERGDIDFDGFIAAFEAEAAELGAKVDASAVLSALLEMPASEVDARPVMLDAVTRYRAGGLQVGLLTNNVAPMGSRPTTAWVHDAFDVVVESCLCGLRKPESEFYLLACSKLGTDPTRTAFLDDLGINLKSARALGMHTVKVTDPAAAIAEIDALLA